MRPVRGEHYGLLSVAIDAEPQRRPHSPNHPERGHSYYWPCRCECGATVWARGATLGTVTISCGTEECQVKALETLGRPLSRRFAGLRPPVGKAFGAFTVIALSHKRDRINRRCWIVRCACGTLRDLAATEVVNGKIKSCGCKHGCHIGKYKDPLQKCWNDLLRRCKQKAAQRRIVFELSPAEFFVLLKLPCQYCGVAAGNLKTWGSWSDTVDLSLEYNGIDRMDSKRGYVLGNCVPCCYICNVMKLQMSEQEFIVQVQRILEHVGTKGL